MNPVLSKTFFTSGSNTVFILDPDPANIGIFRVKYKKSPRENIWLVHFMTKKEHLLVADLFVFLKRVIHPPISDETVNIYQSV